MADTIRIPIDWLRQIVGTYGEIKTWKFSTSGGNTLVAKRTEGVESVDFEYNPGD